MRRLIRKINDLFIALVLFVFYIFVIGITAVVYRLFSSRKKKKNIPWIDNTTKELPVSSFESPY